jgi:F0F1-type ATP synthase membrane subunit c/vacuolar-type H+-ATPase subunit K
MDTVLVLALIALAHLLADFVLQNDWIALNKGKGGRLGWMALGAHGFHVALCLVPAVLAFGWPGLAYLVVVAGTHMLVDRWKVRVTRRAEAEAQAAARKRFEATGELASTGVGNAWSPWPGMLFLADQVLHLTIAVVAWAVLLRTAELLPGWIDAVNAIVRDSDPETFHAVVLVTVVVVSLFLVNTRGGYYFLLALAAPRMLRAEDPSQPAPASTGGPEPAAPVGTDARIFAATSAFERLLMVAAVLVGSALGFIAVLAVEAVARHRQLQDRGYSQWWLLATIGNVTVAVSSGLLAAIALASLAT